MSRGSATWIIWSLTSPSFPGRFLHGVPAYRDLASPDVQANFFGLLTYAIHAVGFAVFGDSIQAGKGMAAAASVVSVAVLACHLWRRHGALLAALGTLFFLSFLLRHTDPHRLRGWWMPLAIGACVGMSVNLKIYSAVFFLPIVVDMCFEEAYRRRLVGVLATAAATAVVIFAAPFGLPQVPALEYAAGLVRMVLGRGLSGAEFVVNLKNILPYLVAGPIFLLSHFGGRAVAVRDGAYFRAFVAAAALVFYPASKPGAGSHHFLPLAPVATDLLVRAVRHFAQDRRIKTAVLAVVPLAFVIISIPVQKRLWRNMAAVPGVSVAAEIETVTARVADEGAEMGFGETFENYRFTYFRSNLVFAGQPLSVDAMTLKELKVSGIATPSGIAQRILACSSRHWLIPRDEKPFGDYPVDVPRHMM